MPIRKTIANKPIVGIAIAVVLLAIVLLRFVGAGADAPTTGQYYLDLDTNELFTRDTDEQPPITAPSGGEGVLAYVFACGSCENDNDRFVAYIEKPAGAAHGETSTPNDTPQPAATAGTRMIRAGDGGPWLNENDPRATAVLNIRDRCPDGGLTKCRP